MQSVSRRFTTIVVASLCLILLTAGMVFGQAAHHKLNWVQRHPTITSIAAGVAAHHALKVAAARDKARGRKLNWAERHPTLTAIGAGAATHAVIKHYTPHNP